MFFFSDILYKYYGMRLEAAPFLSSPHLDAEKKRYKFSLTEMNISNQSYTIVDMVTLNKTLGVEQIYDR